MACRSNKTNPRIPSTRQGPFREQEPGAVGKRRRPCACADHLASPQGDPPLRHVADCPALGREPSALPQRAAFSD